ncbi:restriction endonuclease subunit S [Flavonifractor plautii]|uniref:restriction endonuclease subunit S n=1 Tax=Flavonifractor plautii TaxID=292800 RepID=UPI00232ABB74|nr:restriction endonuclease subunit S [Flavonifractor plautii]MDB7899911.1 restriction endonuclease subunit S [Flavonifractor plautii]
MTAQQLKNSILQMAVQGKLVPQDPNDEPASVLLERIRTEKEQLIKEKKIKREKNPSVIFKGADNTPYEKIGDEVRSLADEVPFDIPDSWEWVRLIDVCEYIQRGKSPKYSPIKKYPVVAQKCNQWSGFSIEKAQFIEPNSLSSYGPERLLQDNDLMWNSTGLGTLGRMAIYKTAANPYELAVADSHVTVIRPLKQFVLPEYLYYYFANPSVQSVIEDQADGTTKQKELATATIKAYLTPIPPLDEQRRILAKLSEVLPVVKNYGVVYDETTAMQEAFPESLKKSILQEAVQGKLVPQDPSDEPAEALLERIRAEKQRLVKEGKIKKDKHESVIFRRDNSHYEKRSSEEVCIDDEIPFEIPESWAWARLSSFGVFSSGKTPSMSNPQFWNGNVPWVTSKDMKRPVITDSEMHISELAAATMQLYPAGTLLLVARSGILKRLLPLCKLGIDSTINQDIKAFSLYDIELSEWLFYGIKAFEPFILKELVKSVTTVESLKFDEFAAMLIPVPPLSEQRRIIDAIKTAMNLLTPLSSNPLFSL